MKIPKHVIGNQWPHDPHTWIVRLRNPLLLARAEERGLIGLRFHCWPSTARASASENKLVKILSGMAQLWCRDVEELPGLPEQWDWIFNEAETPPQFLVCDDYQTEWTGILEPMARRLWLVTDADHGAISLSWCREFGGIDPQLPNDLRAVSDYWKRFCDLEDNDNQ